MTDTATTSTTTSATTAAMRALTAPFARLAESRQAEPQWLREARQAAIDRATAIGFPTTKTEWWKHTNLRPLTKHDFVPAPADSVARVTREQLAPYLVPGLDAHTLVFVNGHFANALSDPPILENITVGPISATMTADAEKLAGVLGAISPTDQPFVALNMAFWADGAFVYLPRNTEHPRPLQILHVTIAHEKNTPIVSYPRTYIHAGTNTELAVVETFAVLGETPTLTNAVTEIFVGVNARVEHVKWQREPSTESANPPAHVHLAAVHAQLQADARFRSHNVSEGAEIVRTDIGARLDAEHVEATLNGLVVSGGRHHVDNHTTLDHAKPNGSSFERYKHLLWDTAHAVFFGRIIVHPDAQKTDAYQSNRTLLLSDGAGIDTMPQLEIYADDVKCSHGATTGRIDDEALFYFRSRGIDAATARVLLSHAFASEVIDEIPLNPLRAELQRMIAERVRAVR